MRYYGHTGRYMIIPIIPRDTSNLEAIRGPEVKNGRKRAAFTRL
jgi:hypothetical protein